MDSNVTHIRRTGEVPGEDENNMDGKEGGTESIQSSYAHTRRIATIHVVCNERTVDKYMCGFGSRKIQQFIVPSPGHKLGVTNASRGVKKKSHEKHPPVHLSSFLHSTFKFHGLGIVRMDSSMVKGEVCIWGHQIGRRTEQILKNLPTSKTGMPFRSCDSGEQSV